MKSLIVFLGLLCALLSAEPLKVLGIGNSFTDSLRRYLPQVVASVDGCEIDMQMAIIGGSDFNHHLDMMNAFEKDGKSRPYPGGKSLKELLESRQWDVITLQQHSDPGREWRFDNRMEPAGSLVLALVRKKCPNARIMLQQTWAYREEHPNFAEYWHITPSQMHRQLRQAQRAFAERHQLHLIPTGDAVELARRRMTVICDDYHHLGANGQYLQACLWMACLFNRSPLEVTFVPQEISAENAAALRAIADDVWRAVKSEHRL